MRRRGERPGVSSSSSFLKLLPSSERRPGRHTGFPRGSILPLASGVPAASSASEAARAAKEEEKEEEALFPSSFSFSFSSSSSLWKRIEEHPTSASDTAMALSGRRWCRGTAQPPAAQMPQSAAAKAGEEGPRTATRGPEALAPVSRSMFSVSSSKSSCDFKASAVALAVSARREKVVTLPVRESTSAGVQGPCARASAAAEVGSRS